MEFTTTARGAPALVFNGFKYVVNRKMPVEKSGPHYHLCRSVKNIWSYMKVDCVGKVRLMYRK